MAYFFDLNNPNSSPASGAVEHAATVLGLEVQRLEVRGPDDYEPAFEAAVRERAEALSVNGDSFSFASANRARIVALAARHRLPTIYWRTEFVAEGGLMAFSPNVPALSRRVAAHVDKILKGAKPSDIPIEQPMIYDTAFNRTTARALGLPPTEPIIAQVNLVFD